MSHDANGSVQIKVKMSDGREMILSKLRPSDFIKLGDHLKERRRDELGRDLKLAGISGDPALAKLQEFSAREVTRAQVLQYLTTDHGDQQAIIMSMRHENKNASESDVDAIDFEATGESMVRIAGRLAGINMDVPPPQTPPAVTTNPTPPAQGNPLPPASDVT